MKLGVNIDHVATLRQARGTAYPDVLEAAFAAQRGGADSITVHLREDRRHIQEHDVATLLRELRMPLNLEMAVTDEMLAIACEVKPAYVCLVPERREELTTEGGLDVAGQLSRIADACEKLRDAGIKTSLFIDAHPDQVTAAVECATPMIEIHTGHYAIAADAGRASEAALEIERILAATQQASAHKIQVNAGHGLNYNNVRDIARLPEIEELNIGHSIVARSVITGLEVAVAEMRKLIDGSERNQ